MLLIRRHETKEQWWTGMLNGDHRSTFNYKRMTNYLAVLSGGDLREMYKEVHNPRSTESVIKITKR